MNVDSKELKSNVGAVLKGVRKECGISQMVASESAGISRSYLAEVEGGTVNLTIDTILRICVALNVRPSAVFKRAGF